MGSNTRVGGLNCVAIVDTSILLLISLREARLDDMMECIAGCTPIVPTPVVRELQVMAGRSRSRKSHLAKWALNNLLQFFNIVEVPMEEGRSVDDALMEVAESMKRVKTVLIVTADTKLKDRALEKGIGVVWYRRERRGFEILAQVI